MQRQDFPSSPLGLHRVIEPAGALPQAAWRLDPSPALWPDEVRVRVDRLNLDAASFRQLSEAAAGTEGAGANGGHAAAMRAAVLGIVNTMASLEGADTATIGHRVGAALVGTFLGILVSYGFVGPIAAAMEHIAQEEAKAFEVVKMALVASVRGYAPPVAVEFARKLLFSEVRPTFSDLEAHLKGKARPAVAGVASGGK